MMNDRTRETQLRLKDKCRGRFHYNSMSEIYDACQKCNGCRQKDPFEYVYNVPEKGGHISEAKYNKTRSSIIVFSMNPDYHSDGSQRHDYFCENDRWFVESFKDNNLKITRTEQDAHQFFSDKEVDECMEYILSHKQPWTISIWEFKGNTAVCECVHYPNEHWSQNKCLQPSLMNKSVDDWLKEHNKL